MKIDISSIKYDTGTSLDFDFRKNIDPISLYGLKLVFKEPLHLQGKAINTGEGILIKANIKIKYKTECSRCNKPVEKLLDFDFCEEFQSSSSDSNGDLNIFIGDEIRLDEVVIENILLNIPMKVLCSPDCKGLCPQCGKDLNTGKCHCKNLQIDPRLAVLKDLFTAQDTDKEV